MSTADYHSLLADRAAPVDRAAGSTLVPRLLGELLFWLVMVQLINGVFLQTQMAAFGGAIVVPNGVPKMALVMVVMALAGVVLLVRRGEIVWRASMLPACIFACYLVADLAWLSTSSTLPLGTLLFGFNKFFLFFAAIPAAALLRPYLTPAAIERRLLLLAIPIVALALAQFVLNDPVLALASEDGEFAVHSVDFYGRMRAFSLFRGVLECGQGLAFLGALLVAQLTLRATPHRATRVLLLVAITAACFVTFRRGAYLEFAAAGLSAWLIARRAPTARWLPVLFLVGGIALASIGTIISAAQTDGLLSSDSLAERHEAWSSSLEVWTKGGLPTILFGTGRTQVDPDDFDNLLIDNGFLAVGVELGFVGLVLWVWVMQALWRDMLATAWRWRTPLATAVAGLLATWMFRDVFDPLFALYPLYAFLVFWSHQEPLAAAAGARPQVIR